MKINDVIKKHAARATVISEDNKKSGLTGTVNGVYGYYPGKRIEFSNGVTIYGNDHFENHVVYKNGRLLKHYQPS